MRSDLPKLANRMQARQSKKSYRNRQWLSLVRIMKQCLEKLRLPEGSPKHAQLIHVLSIARSDWRISSMRTR